MKIALVAHWDWVLFNFRLPVMRACAAHGVAVDFACPDGPYVQAMVDEGFTWRQWHVDRVAAILNSAATTAPPPPITNRLQSALELWRTERQNPSEEFWHAVFLSRPELLAPTVNGRAFTLNSKCYVGGKAIDNSGGNVLDFLAQHSGDVALIDPPTLRETSVVEVRHHFVRPSGGRME